MSHHDWRLILSKPASGPENMAMDEAILEAVQRRRAPPTLRFYAWDPPCLSIGYAQSVDEVDRNALGQEGWGLVRRPTGGKAILHTDEITYSISALADHPVFRQGVLPSYERISLALIQGLKALGVRPELHHVDLPGQLDGNPVCFQNPGAFEITAEGKKLVGSAQVRRGEGVLQHGSIPLQGELGRICLGLHYDSEEARNQAMADVVEYAITVARAVGGTRSWDETARALTTSFEEAFDLRISRQMPEPSEVSRAGEIVRERYSHPDWTLRI